MAKTSALAAVEDLSGSGPRIDLLSAPISRHPPGPPAPRLGEGREERRGGVDDPGIHTLLARFLIDRGDLEGAEKEILAAEVLLEEPDDEAGWRERRFLRSRIDLARGDAEAAYPRLKKGRDSWWLGAEGYALLAVAASETGHERIARSALQEAEGRGVDMRELRKARGAAG